MSENNLEIQFTLTGLASVLRGFKSVERAAKRTGDAVGGMAPPPSGRPLSGAPGSRGTSGGAGAARLRDGARSSRPPLPTSRPVQGPFQRRTRLAGQLSDALARGDADAEKDIRLALERTHKQLARLRPKSFGDRLGSFLRSTRFGAGGAEPLVGRTLDLAGEAGGVVGPLALLGTAALAGARGLKQFTDRAADTAATFARLGYGTGGTPSETARLGTLAAGLGMSSDQMAGLAGRVGEQSSYTSGNPWASAEARRIGIDPRPFPFGSMDDAAKLLKVIKDIRGGGDAHAQRVAREFGAQDLLPVRNLSADQYNQLVRTAQTQADVNGRKYLKTMADYQASVGNVTTALGNFFAVFASPGAKALTKTFGGAATGLNKFAGDARANGLRRAVGDWDNAHKFPAPTWLRPLVPVRDDRQTFYGMNWRNPLHPLAYHLVRGGDGRMTTAAGPYRDPSARAQAAVTRGRIGVGAGVLRGPQAGAAVGASAAQHPVKQLVQALRENTQATRKNSTLLGYPGTYGNPTRQGAFPETLLGGPFTNKRILDMERDAFDLGAF